MGILIIGSVAIDSIKTPFGEVKEVLGGSATYASLAASIFAPVKILSVVGEDFPKKYIRRFKQRRIDISGLKISKGTTFRWVGHYGDNLNEARTISVCPEKLTDDYLEIPEHYKNPDYLFLANTAPDAQDETLTRTGPKKLVALDTMNLWIKNKLPSLKKVLKKVDLLFINESEAKMLACKQNLLSAAKKIIKDGPKIVIIKKGEHGSFLMSKEDFFAVPAYPMEQVKDPTGAGDSFAGGFLGYISSQKRITCKNLRTATVMGAVVASFTIGDFGTKGLEKIDRYSIDARFQKMREILRF
jgi:sugar/nucleoside kinase (ribokinase family)